MVAPSVLYNVWATDIICHSKCQTLINDNLIFQYLKINSFITFMNKYIIYM